MPDTEILMSLSKDVGELKGMTKEFIDAQKVINANHDTRITVTEKTRNTLIGVTLASATGGGGVAALMSKFFGMFHSGS